MNDYVFEDSDAEQQIEFHAITVEKTGEIRLAVPVEAERLLQLDETAGRDSHDDHDREMRLLVLMDTALHFEGARSTAIPRPQR